MDILENNFDGEEARGAGDHPDRWLVVIAVCVVLIAACSAFTAWTVYRQTEMNREVQCAYMAGASPEGDDRTFDDLEPIEQEIARALDCDIPRD